MNTPKEVKKRKGTLQYRAVNAFHQLSPTLLKLSKNCQQFFRGRLRQYKEYKEQLVLIRPFEINFCPIKARRA